jgi:hypothetical protein
MGQGGHRDASSAQRQQYLPIEDKPGRRRFECHRPTRDESLPMPLFAGIYFGTRSGKVYASKDAGNTWKEMLNGLTQIVCVATAVVAELAGPVTPRPTAKRRRAPAKKANCFESRASGPASRVQSASRSHGVAVMTLLQVIGRTHLFAVQTAAAGCSPIHLPLQSRRASGRCF